jgi:O-antigen ligase
MRSTEPIGPFALTNSLAGYLAPTLILVLGLARQMGRTMVRQRMWQGILVMALAALVAALLLACFVLTKSRAAYLATAMGVLALAATRAIPRRWWRWCGAAAAVLALGVLLLASLGGLDRQVLTEAPKSLLYRMQYWQASWGMIAEHPWFGCGPGNFKDAYTQYKLPEASETVADPHNFLVEIAATAGIPVALLSLMAAAAVIWQVRRTQRETRGDEPVVQTAPASDADDSPDDASLVRTVYVGGLAGCLLAYPAGWAGGQTPDLAMLWTLVPVFLVTLWLLHPWVVRGRLPATTLLIAVGTLLVNLLAAGGIAFPGVAGLLWLLVALALNAAETGSGDVTSDTWLSPVGPVVNRGVIAGAAAAAVALVALGYVTLYRPVLAGQIFAAQLADALEGRMNATQITAACRQAAQADPWWAEPYERWAAIAHQQWLAHPTPERLDEFNQAVAGARERNRWSSSLARSEGDWLLAMYHGSRQVQLLQRAAEAYTRAVALYPNSGTLRAQLAWTWYLLGDRQQAAALAAEALQLDEQMPHEELKLKHQRLAGLQLSPVQVEQDPAVEGASAEQVMRSLHKLSRSR